jgi:hypothetical protein
MFSWWRTYCRNLRSARSMLAVLSNRLATWSLQDTSFESQ